MVLYIMILVLAVLIFLCLPISNRKTHEWASANVRAIQETKGTRHEK